MNKFWFELNCRLSVSSCRGTITCLYGPPFLSPCFGLMTYILCGHGLCGMFDSTNLLRLQLSVCFDSVTVDLDLCDMFLTANTYYAFHCQCVLVQSQLTWSYVTCF